MSFRKTLVHVPPVHRSYKGGFASVTYCPSCNKVALTEDMHPIRPCPACGESIHEAGQARWKQIEGGMFKKERGEWTFTSNALAVIDQFYNDVKVFVDRNGEFGEGVLHQPSESVPFRSQNLDFTDLDFTDFDFTK